MDRGQAPAPASCQAEEPDSRRTAGGAGGALFGLTASQPSHPPKVCSATEARVTGRRLPHLVRSRRTTRDDGGVREQLHGLVVRFDDRAEQCEATVAAVGGYVVVIATVVPSLAVTLTSSYVCSLGGHQAAVTHLYMAPGRPGSDCPARARAAGRPNARPGLPAGPRGRAADAARRAARRAARGGARGSADGGRGRRVARARLGGGQLAERDPERQRGRCGSGHGRSSSSPGISAARA